MVKKQLNIKREDLKKYFMIQSKLIDSDKNEASKIFKEEGYDESELKKEGFDLIKKLRKKVRLKETNEVLNWKVLLKKVTNAGISKQFLENRIIPTSILKSVRNNQNSGSFQLIIDYLVEVFDWSRDEILKSDKLTFSSVPSKQAFFKRPSNFNTNQIKAYSHYAQFIAKASSKACHNVPIRDYPLDIDEFRKLILQKSGEINLKSILETVWDLGICIVPLTDSGVFHGACWNIKGRHVIILKQKTSSHAKWIFDLLHELYHVFVHLVDDDTSVIEEDELSPVAANDSVEEREANTFANQLIFNKGVEKLANKCVAKTGKRIENLKSSVLNVAKEENVRVDFLANYMAFRLVHQEINWWGTANSLQVTEPSPLNLTKEYLLQKLDFKELNTIESNMLLMAIN